MARIRTIKPQFFRHEALFEAERECGMPLRLAFIGLWTAADREGRFNWRPRELKLDCLPYDEVDFSRVLDALWTRGFIIKYHVNGYDYGCIPAFSRHQVVNNREAASDLPEPNENNMLTREPRVIHAQPTPLVQDQGEGKGREGKGMDITTRETRRRVPIEFEQFLRVYPKRKGSIGKQEALKVYTAALGRGATSEEINEGARRFAAQERENVGTPYIPQPQKWLRREGWRDFEMPSGGTGPPNGGWRPGLPTPEELEAKYEQKSGSELEQTASVVETSDQPRGSQRDLVRGQPAQQGARRLGEILSDIGLDADCVQENANGRKSA